MLPLIFIAFAAVADAGPMPAAAATTPALCPAVTKLVTALKQQQPASAFCSSFLHIPVATTTLTQTKTNIETVTSVLSGSTTITASIAATLTVFDIPTITVETDTTTIVTSTSTPLSTVTSALTCTPPSAPAKRAATISKPSCLAAFTVSSAISSACQCLSVPTSTSTATASAVSVSTKSLTEGSVATSTYTPTHTTTQPGPPTTTTIVTSTHTGFIVETAPTATTTAYLYPDLAPFKIAAIGNSLTGQFLSSPSPLTHPATPYKFGGPGNVFTLQNFYNNNAGVPKDETLDALVIYNQPNDGQIGPQDRSGAVVTCEFTADSNGPQQQTCPLTCEASWDGLPTVANWNCGGTWYTHDIGSCTEFQAFLVSL